MKKSFEIGLIILVITIIIAVFATVIIIKNKNSKSNEDSNMPIVESEVNDNNRKI